MPVLRPKVTDLQFQLFGRAIHPELFEVHQTRFVERGPYQAKVDITSAGHVVSLSTSNFCLSEVAAAATQPLPNRRKLLQHRINGETSDRVLFRDKVEYEVSLQLEPVDPEVFWTFHHELTQNEERKGMLQVFDGHSRVSLGAISYINIETRSSSLLIQAFHTFPDDFAIIKSQSTFHFK